MLSDDEWTRLREVERDLRVADPQFHRSFDVGARRLRRARLTSAAPRIAAALALALGVFLIAIGSWGAAFVIGALAVLGWLYRAVR